jgi:iron complex transport system substrate-binding protein
LIVRRIAGVVALALVVAACGVSVSTATSLSESAPATVLVPLETTIPETTPPVVDDDFPVTVATGNGELVIQTRPEAIISLSPTATEMLFAVGAGDQVIAVDEYSTFPAAAPVTDLSGFTPNMEAIASYEPDLVIVSNDIEDIIATLGALDIPVMLMPAVVTIEDVFGQIDEVGAAAGHRTEADQLVEALESDLEEVLAGLPDLDEPLTYYHELDPTFYTVTSSTFVGGVYQTLGLVNIADPADVDGFGYPQLSVEYIVNSDPDLIFVTDCCGESIDTISTRPGWDSITAVLTGSVIVVDDDIASRWGPRTIEFLQVVADAVGAVAGG